MLRTFLAVAVALTLASATGLVARQQDPAPAGEPSLSSPEDWSVKITSPLGRTGIVTKVRIVAQIRLPEKSAPVHASFYVDGKPVGDVSAPPYAVDWVDENPFLSRELVVQAQDAQGRTASDKVLLPAFEITDNSEVTSVLLEAGVYDKNGRFMSNLDAASFVVREDGVPQTTDNITRQAVPTTILLLVDNSQSMSRQMEFVRLAAERLGDALRRHDQVIVVPFNKELGVITGPTNDAKTIGGAVAAMRAQGGTAILDSVRASERLLEGADGRRVIILITDGYDEHSAGDLETTLRSAQDSQIAVYVVGIGGVAGISLKGERLLRELADKTGGRMYYASRETQLPEISNEVLTEVYSRYLISYTPSNKKKDGTWREIAVEVPGGYRVRTRAGYVAPSPPPIRPTLELTVMNSSHEYLDIAREDLEIVEDGVVQRVDTFQEAVEPVSMVMALDSSGSMVKAADAVRQAARDFVAAVRPEDSLALITFADHPVYAHGLGTTRQFTLDAIDHYVAAGGTSLYDAVFDSLMTLKKVPGRKAVVVMTDGRDENNPGTAPGSEHTFDDVLNLVRSGEASIFAIGLGARVEHDVLDRLASESGGEAYFPADVSALEAQYKSVIENLRRRYVLSYTSSNTAHDGAWRSVEVRSRITGLKIATRDGYFAPGE